MLCLAACATAGAQAPAAHDDAPVEIARGVRYLHLRRTTPQGEPWSIHVLELDRSEKSIRILTSEGHDAAGQMQRELPTAMAARAQREGNEVLAVVNGDYDLAEPYFGVSSGLSVVNGRVWTSTRRTWPVFALIKGREPIIAVPELQLELRAGHSSWTVTALNKPPAFDAGPGPRAYTKEFRPAVTFAQPIRSVVIEKLSAPMPLRVNAEVRGTVREVREPSTRIDIPTDFLVVTLPAGSDYSALKPGVTTKLRITLRVAGRREITDVIGGFPIIVEDGKPRVVGEPGANLKLRHPRTAACYNTEKIIFTVVDGRQPQLSVGMTLEELGELMVSLGCTTAMNTDGGGSSVMAIQRDSAIQIVNSPSDGKERGRGNAWIIVRKH